MKDNLTLSTHGFLDHFIKSYGTVEEFKFNSGFFYKKYITKDDIFFEPKLAFLYKNKNKKKDKLNTEKKQNVYDHVEEDVIVNSYFDDVKEFKPFCDKEVRLSGRRQSISRIVRREVKRQMRKLKRSREMIVKDDSNKG